MANFNALSSVMRALLGEQRADILCVGTAAYPPQFLDIQLGTNSCDKRMGNLKSALIARTALSYPYLKENSFIQ
jgi:hypothetical protein